MHSKKELVDALLQSVGCLVWTGILPSPHHGPFSPMLWSLFFLLYLYFRSVFAKPVTTIIDDAFPGDTHSSVSYSPPNAWGIGSSTSHGRIVPDASQAQDGTWHDTTDDTTPDHDGATPTVMEVNFQGTGIDVRCIIANNKADPSIPPFTGTKANYSFFIDTVAQNQDYNHVAGTTGDAFLYNTSVFSTNGLSNGPHTLKLLLNGGPDVDGAVLLLFDYAIVTSDDAAGDGASGTTAPGTTSAPAITSPVKPSTSSSSQSTTTTGPGSSITTAGGVSQTQGPTVSASTTPSASTFISATPAPSPVQSPPARSSSFSPIPSSAARTSNIGVIVGGLAGGLVALILLLLFFWRRRRRSPRLPTSRPIDPHIHRSGSSSLLRSFTSRKTREAAPSSSSSPPLQKRNPNRSAQARSSQSAQSVGASASLSSDVAMRDVVLRLREEVELLREQQREMLPMQSPSSTDPPPRYEDIRTISVPTQ
ncbi:hypothetical protein DFH09DRAFT_558068 [Mycena vulgaris]|nr:hypothetical protein DFH09DRAFT_558068 [Mycena vulgaris]